MKINIEDYKENDIEIKNAVINIYFDDNELLIDYDFYTNKNSYMGREILASNDKFFVKAWGKEYSLDYFLDLSDEVIIQKAKDEFRKKARERIEEEKYYIKLKSLEKRFKKED